MGFGLGPLHPRGYGDGAGAPGWDFSLDFLSGCAVAAAAIPARSRDSPAGVGALLMEIQGMVLFNFFFFSGVWLKGNCWEGQG